MVNDKEQAREQECKDDEVAVVIYDYLRDTRYF